MKANCVAVQAQVKVTQSLTGTSDRLGQVDGAYRRAEDKMLGMRDKADAAGSLISQGFLEDPLEERSRHSHAVEDDLAMLKVHLRLSALISMSVLPATDEKTEVRSSPFRPCPPGISCRVRQERERRRPPESAHRHRARPQ